MPPVTRDSLLAMKVSRLLELHESALDVLVEHGFTPLAHTHLRALLAPTVTLAQAIRLRSLPPDREEALLAALERLVAAGDGPPAGAEGAQPGAPDAGPAGEAAACR